MTELSPISVLLVEDDENKRRRVLDFYLGAFPGDNIEYAVSLVSGLRKAGEMRPHLVILDMTLPNYPDDRSASFNPMRPFAGREFLRQMTRFNFGSKVVVLTQFETFGTLPNIVDLNSLDSELHASFPENYLGAIYYHASRSSWQSKLKEARTSLGGFNE